MLNAYIAQITWLHRIPATLKLTCLGVLTTLLLQTNSVALMTTATSLSVLAYVALGDPGLRRLVVTMRTTGLISFLIGLFQFGACLKGWTMGDLYDAGLTALLAVLRLIAMVMIADLVSITTPLNKMLSVVESLVKLMPISKVWSRELALTVAVSIRSVAVLKSALTAVNEALHSRGLRIHTGHRISILLRKFIHDNENTASSLMARKLRHTGNKT